MGHHERGHLGGKEGDQQTHAGNWKAEAQNANPYILRIPCALSSSLYATRYTVSGCVHDPAMCPSLMLVQLGSIFLSTAYTRLGGIYLGSAKPFLFSAFPQGHALCCKFSPLHSSSQASHVSDDIEFEFGGKDGDHGYDAGLHSSSSSGVFRAEVRFERATRTTGAKSRGVGDLFHEANSDSEKSDRDGESDAEEEAAAGDPGVRSGHQQKRHREHQRWFVGDASLVERALTAEQARHGPPSVTSCSFCLATLNLGTSLFRCEDCCSGAYLCHGCSHRTHTVGLAALHRYGISFHSKPALSLLSL